MEDAYLKGYEYMSVYKEMYLKMYLDVYVHIYICAYVNVLNMCSSNSPQDVYVYEHEYNPIHIYYLMPQEMEDAYLKGYE
jgi:hypothetical protein